LVVEEDFLKVLNLGEGDHDFFVALEKKEEIIL